MYTIEKGKVQGIFLIIQLLTVYFKNLKKCLLTPRMGFHYVPYSEFSS